MLSIGWFSTGRGEGSLGLLKFIQERILQQDMDARIQFVFSNREPAEAEGSDLFFQMVESYGLPLVTFSSRQFRRSMGGDFAGHRTEYDREVMTRLSSFSPDICILAGYNLIFDPEICRRYTLINIHPALPSGPIGTWQEVIWSLIESRAPKTGAMLHLVTEELDRGPLVSYFTLPLTSKPFVEEWQAIEGKSITQLKESCGEWLPLFRLIRREEYRRELHLLAETLKTIANGTIRIENRAVVDSTGRPLSGLCLDSKIEEALAKP